MKKRLLPAALLALLLTGCFEAMPMQMDSEGLERLESEAQEQLAAATETEAETTESVEITETEAPAEPTTEAETDPPTEEPTTEPPTEEPTTEPPTEPPTDPPTEAPTSPQDPQDGKTVMTGGCMVVNSGTDHARAIELYGGKDSVGVQYANVLSNFKAKLSDDVRVYCMVVPTSAAYYIPEDHKSSSGDQAWQYQNISSNLNGVQGVPLYDAMLAHRSEPIYSRTDYHWQPLGAYYAAEQFAQAAEVPFDSLDTYQAVTREGYVGAFARVNKISELYNAPETFTYYKPGNLDELQCWYYNTDFSGERSGSMFHENNSVNASYTVFIGTDECIFRTETKQDNGRVLVIFKDSYGNAMVPFLTGSFSTIYLCDFRFFNTDAKAFVENVGATDVAFALSTVACTTSAKVQKMAQTLGV